MVRGSTTDDRVNTFSFAPLTTPKLRGFKKRRKATLKRSAPSQTADGCLGRCAWGRVIVDSRQFISILTLARKTETRRPPGVPLSTSTCALGVDNHKVEIVGRSSPPLLEGAGALSLTSECTAESHSITYYVCAAWWTVRRTRPAVGRRRLRERGPTTRPRTLVCSWRRAGGPNAIASVRIFGRAGLLSVLGVREGGGADAVPLPT
ncbi:hypothetical protein EDB89DRAFT_588552 [Lactarius sanguifluus]|nr:hypothetical protein EDB89DRAFT_588552 [Lactarius sanguifluus]